MKKTFLKLFLTLICLISVYPVQVFADSLAKVSIQKGEEVYFRLDEKFQINSDQYKILLFAKTEFQSKDVWICIYEGNYTAEELEAKYRGRNGCIETAPLVKEEGLKLFEKNEEGWKDCIGILKSRMNASNSSYQVFVNETGVTDGMGSFSETEDFYILIEEDQTILSLELAEELYGFDAEIQENRVTIYSETEVFSEEPIIFTIKEKQNNRITLSEYKEKIQVIIGQENSGELQQAESNDDTELMMEDQIEEQRETKNGKIVSNDKKMDNEKQKPAEETETEEQKLVVEETGIEEQKSAEETETEEQKSVVEETGIEEQKSAEETETEEQKPVVKETEIEEQKPAEETEIEEQKLAEEPETGKKKFDQRQEEMETETQKSEVEQGEIVTETQKSGDESKEIKKNISEKIQEKSDAERVPLTVLLIILVLALVFVLLWAVKRLSNTKEKIKIPIKDNEDTLNPEEVVETQLRRIVIKGAVINNKGRVRGNNEDNFLFNGVYMHRDARDKGAFLTGNSHDAVQIYAVCDGMGGADSGEEASYQAVKELADREGRYQYMLNQGELTSVLRAISGKICEEAKLREQKSGTTLVMMLVAESRVIFANVGDSRIYRFRNQKLTQISMDHSKVQRLISMGLLTPEQARTDPSRHVITQYLGMPSDIKISPYIVSDAELCRNDIYVLCSDGLTDMVEDQQIENILRDKEKPQEAVQELFRTAMDNGGRDNVTIMILFIK